MAPEEVIVRKTFCQCSTLRITEFTNRFETLSTGRIQAHNVENNVACKTEVE